MFKKGKKITNQSRRHLPRRSLLFLLVVSLLASTGLVCKCTPNSSSSLSEAEELQALARADEVFHQSFDLDGNPDMVNLLNHLGSDPAFQAYGPSPDGSVWAYLTNGRLVVFIAPVLDAPDTSDAPVQPAAALDAPIPISALSRQAVRSSLPGGEVFSSLLDGEQQFDLPSNDLVLIMNGLPWNGSYTFDDVQLALWFTEQKYKVTLPEGGIQVDDLYLKDKGVDYGVFIIGTHGGLACVELVTISCPEWVSVLATNTPVTPENQRRYADDLDHHRLAYVGSKDYPGNYYAFTESFITEHMHFADNSLVYLDACSGYNLASAFTAANASVVLGWDNPTTSDDIAYFFDRMLGINEIPAPYQPKPEPPNRPFDYKSVYFMMHEFYMDIDPIGVDVYESVPGGGYQKTDRIVVMSNFIISHGGGSFGLLLPTIEHLEVEEEDEKLTLVGLFGSEEGEVFINDTQLEATWGSEKIVAELPAADDSDGTGPVYVKVREHESNKVPLTLWHVGITYQEGPDQTITAYQWLDLDIYWRADAHMYRSLPDGMRSSLGIIPLVPAQASSAKWRCQWDGSYAGFTFKTETWEGDLTLTYDGDPEVFSKDGTFSSTGTLDAVLRQIVDLQFIVNFDPETMCMVTTTGYGISDTQPTTFVLLPGLLRKVGDYPGLEPLFLGDDYELTGEDRSLFHDGDWPWLLWETTPAENPPDDLKTDA